MNRRNFLAFIPALSAIPIVGKHLEQDKEKIVIYQPEDVLAYKGTERFAPSPDRLSLLVVDDTGKIWAVGSPYHIEHECPIYESHPLGDMPIREGRLTVKAQLEIIEDTQSHEFYHKYARNINFIYNGHRA
jgi:hypothetical protein